MSSAPNKSPTPWLVAGFHLLACAGVLLFVDYWPDILRTRSPASNAIGAASLLVCVGADVCLLGLWAALSPAGSVAKWLATGVSAFCWCGVYTPDIFHELRHWSDYGSGWQHEFFRYGFLSEWASVGGLSLLVVSILTCSLSAAKRRGMQFRVLSAEEAALERSSRHFRVLLLLLLMGVVSLFMSFSVNCQQWLSRQICMRWHFAAYAPIQSAETVLVSAVLQAAGTLVVAWAALTYGRPWLRLLMALVVAGFFGLDWSFSFTDITGARPHREHLVWNCLLSACVAVLQAVLVSAALLVVRRRGYRPACKLGT
ncbi:MAG TPA: hypothetical protein VG125_04670 [Pirellulales bacterium]|jgi:hypothetical protein|nr:hypothetical protein [Pirellulales bacterium]